AIQVLLPPLLFLIISKSTDHHLNRPDVPWGYFESVAGIKSVFLPHHPPFGFLGKLLGDAPASWEGWSYIGLASVIVLIIALINAIFKYRERITFQFSIPYELRI